VEVKVLLLLACVAVAAAALSACGGSGRNEVTIATASPKERVEAVNMDGIHSGQISTSFFLSERDEKELIGLRFAVFFKGLGEGGLPQFQATASSQSLVHGRNVDFNGSFFLLPDEVVLVYGHAYQEKPYKPDKRTFEVLIPKLEEAQEEGGEGDLTACLEAAEGLQLASLLRSLKNEGRSEVSGVTGFVVSGDIDVGRLAEMLVHLAEDRRCGAQLRALGLPPTAPLKALMKEVVRRVEDARATLTVDKHGLPRELRARIEVERAGREPEYLEVTWALNSVNQRTQVFGSPNGRPLEVLLRKFDTDTETALEAAPSELILGFLRGLSAGLSGELP
jgi:hypothetical protein